MHNAFSIISNKCEYGLKYRKSGDEMEKPVGRRVMNKSPSGSGNHVAHIIDTEYPVHGACTTACGILIWDPKYSQGIVTCKQCELGLHYSASEVSQSRAKYIRNDKHQKKFTWKSDIRKYICGNCHKIFLRNLNLRFMRLLRGTKDALLD